jgi:predicted GTPase
MGCKIAVWRDLGSDRGPAQNDSSKGGAMSIFRPKRPDPDSSDIGGLTPEDVQAVREEMQVFFKRRPPTIGVIGVSGTGKSSAINAMFRTTLEISHTRACTKEFRATDMELKILKGPAKDDPISLVVIDAPGLGEDVRMDPVYIAQYLQQLPECDVILWLMAARNRAASLDQQYLQRLVQFHDRIVFGLNQIDIVHPMDWNDNINLPSVEMEANIAEIVQDRSEKIADVVGRAPDLVPFSVSKGFNLEMLFNRLITSAPDDRKFVFDLLKNFSYKDFIPAEVQHLIQEQD